LTVLRDDPSMVWAFTFDAEAVQARLFLSTDGGATFEASAAMPPSGFVPLSLEVAPSDADRIYLAGLSSRMGALARSLDGGDSWEVVPIPEADQSAQPFIGAVDPLTPDRLYVRLYTSPGRLLVSDDAGDGWDDVFSIPGFMRGLALSPDGSEIVVGSENGVWLAPTSSLRFTAGAPLAVMCLAWGDRGIYACGHQLLNDGFAVALSNDGAQNFAPLVGFNCIRGLLDCGAETAVGDLCPAAFPVLADQLALDTCGASDAGTSGGAPPAPLPPEPGGDCDCRAGTGTTKKSPTALVLLAAALLGWRRSRLLRAGRP
jgi:hypothetical protein